MFGGESLHTVIALFYSIIRKGVGITDNIEVLEVFFVLGKESSDSIP